MATRSEQIKSRLAPKPVAKPNIKDYPNTKEGLARYDKALAAYNRYVKSTGKSKPQTAQEAAQSGQYGRYGRPSSQVKFEKSKPAPKATSKPAPKATTSKPAAKPAPTKPAAKPKPAAAKTPPKPAAKEYYGPGGKPKRASLKEQVADLKKSGTGSQRFKEMAEKARKEMMEKRKKQSKSRSTGSRKPGSMY